MASRKLTFTLPEDLAAEFLRRIPSSNRSQYVATAIRARLRDREEQLARACEVANSAADLLNIEADFDGFADEVDRVQEPW
jgi:metal-responsive CopG/Arc/MetJ family transcriptional regulator